MCPFTISFFLCLKKNDIVYDSQKRMLKQTLHFLCLKSKHYLEFFTSDSILFPLPKKSKVLLESDNVSKVKSVHKCFYTQTSVMTIIYTLSDSYYDYRHFIQHHYEIMLLMLDGKIQAWYKKALLDACWNYELHCLWSNG